MGIKQNEMPHGGGEIKNTREAGAPKTQPDDVTALRRPGKKARERRLPEGAGQLTGFLATRLC